MSFSRFEIVKIVGGCYFYGPRSKFTINKDGIGYDRDRSCCERQSNLLADILLVTWVFRVDGDGSVSQ